MKHSGSQGWILSFQFLMHVNGYKIPEIDKSVSLVMYLSSPEASKTSSFPAAEAIPTQATTKDISP